METEMKDEEELVAVVVNFVEVLNAKHSGMVWDVWNFIS